MKFDKKMKPRSLLLLVGLSIASAAIGQSKTAGRPFNTPYTGPNLQRIAFPIGGIGAGMFCLEGTGCISHLSIRHAPDVDYEPPVFAALSVKGQPGSTRVLEGPVPDWKKFGGRQAGLGDV